LINRFRAFQSEGLAGLLASSTVIETARGSLEYAVQGQGLPLLVAHGSMGGYDQGLTALHFLQDAEVMRIVPSRFGYLRSTLPPDASAAAQAEAYATLLDALEIDRAWVVGLSSGGMSALQFTRQFPQRCHGLIMISAISGRVNRPGVMPWMVKHVLTNDFLGWYLATHHPRLVARSTGDDYALAEGDPALKAAFLSLAWPALASRRRDGMLNDFRQADQLADDGLQPLAVPLLVIHGTVDPFVPFDSAERLLALNPQARQLAFENGGHLSFLLHQDQTKAAILGFIGLANHGLGISDAANARSDRTRQAGR